MRQKKIFDSNQEIPNIKFKVFSWNLLSLFMLSQTLLFVSPAWSRVLSRAHGRCLFSTKTVRVFDGHCVIKHKENQGNQIVIVELDNGTKYRLAGSGWQALQVEAWDGVHNVRYKEQSNGELFVWNVGGDKNRLSVKADTIHDPNVSHNDSTEDALGTVIGAAVGAVIGNLLTGGSSNNNTTASNPYTTREYDAIAYFKWSLGSPSHDKSCPGGINRGSNGSASIRVKFPNGKERVYNFDSGNVTSPNGGNLTWGKQADEWYIGVDNQEFIIIPDAAIYGG